MTKREAPTVPKLFYTLPECAAALGTSVSQLEAFGLRKLKHAYWGKRRVVVHRSELERVEAEVLGEYASGSEDWG
jgi:hypothetical protein